MSNVRSCCETSEAQSAEPSQKSSEDLPIHAHYYDISFITWLAFFITNKHFKRITYSFHQSNIPKIL